MTYTVREHQIRLNSLDFLHKYDQPFLVVDGKSGRKTKTAIDTALKHFNKNSPLELFDASGLLRVHWHWTGGAYEVSDFESGHYHSIHDVHGKCHECHSPESQANYSYRRKVGLSHTLNANRRAIGRAIDCMGGATEQGTVDPGNYPPNWDMIHSMLERTAKDCKMYDIRVSPWTTLSHAEVQPTLGIKQKWKWDIRVLPDDPQKLLGAVEVGNILREKLRCYLK